MTTSSGYAPTVTGLRIHLQSPSPQAGESPAAQDSSPMLGCVTLGSRNIAFAMNTDDVVIWFTVGEDLRSPSLSPTVKGDLR
jgi:hypothetical protein